MHTILSCSLFALLIANGAALPQVDFDRMGTVALTGTFAGLDVFRNSSTSISFDPSTSSLFTRLSDGSLIYLASTNAGGRISAGCVLGGVLYLAGSFSSIGNTSAFNVASYPPASSSFATLGSNGPNGPVDTVFCDSKGNKLWVGGAFTSPGASVAVWDVKSSSWSSPPFTGLSGAQSRVFSITTNSSDSSLFFAGSFITTFQGSDGPLSNGTNNPNVPFSSGATPFSSSLVPIPLKSAEVLGDASSTDPQFSNIRSILCPAGNDSPGNTWFAADHTDALVTVRTFTFISVNGIRLGNTFLPDHGTTAFSVTTIPDNKVQTLRYKDPATGQLQACTDPCPLSTDPSILYQDFLFDTTLSVTGVQIKLSNSTGLAPGLHILQLLSSGAFASAVDANNEVSCFASAASNTTKNGNWSVKEANTNIPGTIQQVLFADVNVGTSSSAAPSLTWFPYVSAAGNYDVNLLVPGCTSLQDCALRTTVKVTVFAGEGILPWVTTVSQQNEKDAVLLVYSGPISPSSSNFATTITVTLADTPVGTGQNGKYEIVADRVQLVYKSDGHSSSGPNSPGLVQGEKSSFGFFEWPLHLAGLSVDATKVLPNTTITSLDAAGFSLFDGAGGSTGLIYATPPAITSVVHHPSGLVVFGGNFTLSSSSASGSANIVAFTNGSLLRLSDNGLNGPVTSLLFYGDLLFVGGEFTDTLTGSTSGRLRNLAVYDIQKSTWNALGAGVDGPVVSLGMKNGLLSVAGNFTRQFISLGEPLAQAFGFAVWDINAERWVNSGGFVSGSMTFIANGTSSTQVLAGNVIAHRRYGASGMVFLKNGGQDGPIVSTFGAQLDDLPHSQLTSKRRSTSFVSSGWVAHFRRSKLFSRQSLSTQLSSLPSSPPALAPSVLAGAFWANSSASRDKQVTILGGNFSFSSPGSSIFHEGVALYNPSSRVIRGLTGMQINGIARTLLVDGSRLYIGGEFHIQGSNINGLAIYDLLRQEWDLEAIQPLQPSAGSTVVVRSITKSTSKPNNIIVAGSFVQAGSLPCEAICIYNAEHKQWSSLGDGIQGEIASVAYAGEKQEFLIASGSIAITDRTVSNVALFSFANSTWRRVGASSDLPGPVTAVEVNNGNLSSIFAAGRSMDGSSPFLSFWDGHTWRQFDSNFYGNTSITQLSMVPLQGTHAASGVIERDRVLLVSGLLDSSSFGTASSVLFDGRTFIPYIISTTVVGAAGAASGLFRSFSSFSFKQHHILATGVVILISIAISAGVVFLIALTGIVWTLLSRRDDKLGKDVITEDDDDSAHLRPSSLLEHINAATRTTILGTSPFEKAIEGHEEEKAQGDISDPFTADTSNFIRSDTPSDVVGGTMVEETSRLAHARYSFDGTGDGELRISAGAEVEVLDNRDPDWWYARDARTGREGVVPAAYLY